MPVLRKAHGARCCAALSSNTSLFSVFNTPEAPCPALKAIYALGRIKALTKIK